MKLNELEKLLSSSGYILNRCNKHRIWVKLGFSNLVIPNHKFVNKMIVKKILKGIDHA